MKALRWKFLLGVFKLKRIVNRWFGVRKLDYPKHDIFIMTHTLREYQTRARSVRKEPRTVSWIESQSGDGKVLYDIGANIGAYSLIAAALGYKVYAFEPGLYNTATLEENILLNRFGAQITVVPLALGTTTKLGHFTVLDPTSGSSRGFYNEAHFYRHDVSKAIDREVFALSLDDMVTLFKLPLPTALKIDVDGGEVEVVKGAGKTLTNESVKSVLIEVDTAHTDEILSLMAGFGFSVEERTLLDVRTENIIFARA